MFDKILSMTWEEFMNSELLFKSNAWKHVIEISGSELKDGDDSTILVYCNVYNGTPMAVVVHYSRRDVQPPEFTNKDYSMAVTSGVDDDGKDYTEFVFVLRAMQKALDS